MYRVYSTPRRTFDTLDAANAYAQAYFVRTGCVVAIIHKSPRKPAKYPGYRTMTGAERRNARMHKIFDDAIARAKAEGKSSPWG